jgi:hypothetical protein
MARAKCETAQPNLSLHSDGTMFAVRKTVLLERLRGIPDGEIAIQDLWLAKLDDTHFSV